MHEYALRDPVCGMEIAAADAVASSEYNGRQYYFCSKACKDAFDKEPARYVGQAEPAHAHGCC